MPDRAHPERRGDLYVRLRIVLPPVIDEDLKKAVIENEKRHPYDPQAELSRAA